MAVLSHVIAGIIRHKRDTNDSLRSIFCLQSSLVQMFLTRDRRNRSFLRIVFEMAHIIMIMACITAMASNLKAYTDVWEKSLVKSLVARSTILKTF